MEYGSEISNFSLKMKVKNSVEKLILKSLHGKRVFAHMTNSEKSHLDPAWTDFEKDLCCISLYS